MTYYKKEDGAKLLKWNGTYAVKTKLLIDAENASYGVIVTNLIMTEENIKDFEWEEIGEDEYMNIRDGKMEDYWLMTSI